MTPNTNLFDLKDTIGTQTDAAFESVQALYRQLHQHPELPFQEHETSARLAEALEVLGYDLTRGQHNMPALAGTVGHRADSTMAACTNLAVTIHGAGGHGSMPAQTVDPVVIAAHIVTRLQTIVSREVPPEETVVVTVGKLHAGTQANIIPHAAELEINIRSFNNTLHRQVVEAIERIVRAECEAGRAPKPPEFRILNETIALHNDPATVEQVRRAHGEHFGVAGLYDMPRLSGSEDFPYFGNAKAGGFGGEDIPYVYWFIGATPKERLAGHAGRGRAGKDAPPGDASLALLLPGQRGNAAHRHRGHGHGGARISELGSTGHHPPAKRKGGRHPWMPAPSIMPAMLRPCGCTRNRAQGERYRRRSDKAVSLCK